MAKKPTYKELENKIRELEHLDYEKSFSIINSERNALRALINSISDEIWICDADGNIILVNTAALQGLGYKNEEDVNQPLLSFLTRLKIYTTDGEPRSQNDAPLLRSLTGEILTQIEELVRDPNSDRVRHRMVNSSPIKNADGRIVGAVAVVRDITREKEIEKHARKMADLLKETQRLTKVGGWEFDVASGNVTWTDEIYRIYGVDKDFYDPNDIDRDIQFYAPEAQSLLKKAFKQATDKGIPYDLELKFNRADDEQIWVRTIGKPVMENGTVKRVHGNFIDITRFKILENDLERALMLLESVYDSLDEAVFVVDPQTRNIISCNRAAEQIFGYSKDEILGRNTEFIHVNKKTYREFGNRLANVLKTGRLFHTEFNLRKKDGTIFPSEHTVKTVTDESGHPTINVSVVRDITFQKTATQQLKKNQSELQRKAGRLEELNTALRVLLDQRNNEKENIETQLTESVNGLIIPYLDRIRKTHLTNLQKEYLDILESTLRQITNPYNHRVSHKLMYLTPTETRVANYVREGHRIKEIAAILNVSPRTVEFHRDNIRKKLGIKNSKINLKTFLSNI